MRPLLAWLIVFAGICRVASAWAPGTGSPAAVQGFVVDPANRTDVLSFYNTIYTASEGYAQNIAWTGNVSAGVAGTTSAAFKDDVRRRINFYRALVGLPADIAFNDTKCAKCQEAALMFSANGAISHTPPTSWTFYTADGAAAAGNSDLFLGQYGAGAIDGFIVDPGSSNTIVGHRRWLLYSLAQEMGTGDVPPNGSNSAGNAVWVIGNFKTSGPTGFVPWPNKGFVPQALVPARWSISYPGANFASATVAMSQGGSSVPLTVVSRADNGYGDNTIVWEPSGLVVSGQQDVPVNVTVSGIGGPGVPASYSYTVTAFNPGVLGQTVTISGTSAPLLTGQAYTFNAITQADAYQLRVSRGSTAAWTEGAETLASVIDLTAPDYPLAQSTVTRSGAQAFHLAFPSIAAGTQGFEVNRDIVPSASSQLAFYDLFRWVTTGSRLSAEISDDNGATWTEIWSRNGNGSTSSSGWDTSFNARSVSLAAYAGKPVRIRFMFSLSGSTFIGADTNYGVFLDDISVSAATELLDTTTTTLPGSATSFTLDPATAGAALAAGTSYYLRIRPNVGTKWFGDGPLKIVVPVLASDTTNPSVAISSPAPNARLTSVPILFSGNATDNVSVSRVQFSANNGTTWGNATLGAGTTSRAWTANVTVPAGPASILFRAVDSSGNIGANVARQVTYGVPATLNITATGGNVTVGFSGNSTRDLNVSYTVTATPVAGKIFRQWLANGVSVSRSATYTFKMTSGLKLVPEFIANPFPAVAGEFNGLVGDGELGYGTTAGADFVAQNGFLAATVGGNGSFAGSLRLDGLTTPISGHLDGFGQATLSVARTSKPTAAVSLALALVAPGRLTGNVTVGGVALPFDALPGIYTGANGSVSPLSGRRYNVALKPQFVGPAGYGYGSLTFSANGTGTFSGKLADGTPFAATARSGDDLLGNWVVPVHVPLYAGTGILWGELSLPKTTPAATVADVTGELAWIRPANATATSFKLGFITAVDALGARFLPVAGQSLLTGTSATAAFHLKINGVERTPATLTANGTWTATNAATLTAPPAGTTWTFAPTTGLFSGNFTYGSGTGATTQRFEGLLLTKPLLDGTGTIRGAGFHTGGNSSAPVLLSK